MRQNNFLNSLVQDCIIFNLDTKESLLYIKARYGKPISRASFNRRKASILSDHSTDIWLHNFTRIGYVKNHQQDIQVIRKLRDDSLKQLQTEIDKPSRDEYKILRIKQDIRDNTHLLSELNSGTPIISAIKAKVEGNNRNETRLSVT
jgi:hypothetical protein